ncbi:MAG: hypothetical protein US68_C0018G0006 [Candidatus Shapirobacteria bacterium GW2011_GWE1_38_10]|uniref:Uncharacterized protein n=1 Tax=Candidatus Shapirobacteria bacterium GW2011_GWE1_38_10 TaxID=1618488 RepID=A0A0G0IDX9_9BACT|nr:MAG: hypothetical protein US68_C0018G0006 [Candidatus Shapirobacteria bacterium GW2011_GWE1_38_10]
MSLKERLTTIIRKIPTKINVQQNKSEDPMDIDSQDLKKKTTKSLGPMITRVILGRYEVPSHNTEDSLK